KSQTLQMLRQTLAQNTQIRRPMRTERSLRTRLPRVPAWPSVRFGAWRASAYCIVTFANEFFRETTCLPRLDASAAFLPLRKKSAAPHEAGIAFGRFNEMKRLAYIDWMRGLACILMFQTHCYDSWLSPEARKSPVLIWSQLGGTFPAPLFIFLAGISFALVTERLREKGTDRRTIAKQTIRRGAEIFGLGLLFRIQEYALAFGYAPWTDLFRVDVLNILGLSMILMGVLCFFASAESVTSARNRTIAASLAAATLVAMLTPPLWTTYRPKFLPWPLESFFNGFHIFNEPQSWLFPLFPWAAFAFSGLAVGFLLYTDFAKQREALAFTLIGVGGIVTSVLSQLFDKSPIR